MITDAAIVLYMDDYQLLLVERRRRLRLFPGTRRKTDAKVVRQAWPSPWKFRTDLGPVYRETWHKRSTWRPAH